MIIIIIIMGYVEVTLINITHLNHTIWGLTVLLTFISQWIWTALSTSLPKLSVILPNSCNHSDIIIYGDENIPTLPSFQENIKLTNLSRECWALDSKNNQSSIRVRQVEIFQGEEDLDTSREITARRALAHLNDHISPNLKTLTVDFFGFNFFK